MFNNSVQGAIVKAGVIHEPDNLSNYSPIYVKLEVNNLNTIIERSYSEKKASWTKATTENKDDHEETVANKLNSIQVPSCIYCEDLYCQYHSIMIEDYTVSVLEAIENSAKETLLSIGDDRGNRRYNTVAGWNASFGIVWASAGKPLAGGLYDIMNHTKPNIDMHLGGSLEPGTNFRIISLLMNFLKGTLIYLML